jgi:hypothetical protein
MPVSYHVVQAGLKFLGSSDLGSPLELGLQLCTTVPGFNKDCMGGSSSNLLTLSLNPSPTKKINKQTNKTFWQWFVLRENVPVYHFSFSFLFWWDWGLNP